MITDTIGNASGYIGIHPGIHKALDHLAATDWTAVSPGRYALDGDRLYASVEQYETRPACAGTWEAHRRYIDVQYVISGVERMGYAPVETLEISEPYDETRDCLRLKGDGDILTVPAGTFVIFFPQDAHMPGLVRDLPAPVRKVVVKVNARS